MSFHKAYRVKTLLVFLLLLTFIPTLSAQSIYDQIFIAPGVNYTVNKTENPPLTIHTVDIDLTSPFIQLETVLAKDSLFNREILSSMATRNSAVVAINGDFFDPNTGNIINLMVKNGEIIRAPIPRGVFAITKDNLPVISLFTLGIDIETQYGTIKVNNLNIPRGGNEAVLFTDKFGKNTMISNSTLAGIDVELLNFSQPLPPSGIITARIGESYYGVTASTIPQKGGTLSIGGKALSYLPYLKKGDTVRIITKLNPSLDIIQAIGGGAILLKDGNIVFGSTGEQPLSREVTDKKNPLTVVAIDNNNRVYFIIVDGRNNHSDGMTYLEMAQYLKNIGMKDALALDGGGSSELIVRDKIMNSPSDGRERAIANALIVRASLPAESPSILTISPRRIVLKEGEVYRFSPLLQDKYGNLFPIDLEKIKWSTDNINGSVTKDGTFYANSSGNSRVIARFNGLEAISEVSILPADSNLRRLEDFENNPLISISGSGFDPGSTRISLSNSTYLSGRTSLRLDYSLLEGIQSFIYINLNIPLPRESKKLGFFLYGDKSGHWLRGMFRDSNGRIWVGNFTPATTGIDWEGWKYLELDLSSLDIFAGDKTARIEPPLELLQLYMVEIKEERKNQGTIYIDSIQTR